MIDRQHGQLIVECDSCGAVLDTRTSAFDETRAVMRQHDWKVRQIGRDWIHGCPSCGVPA